MSGALRYADDMVRKAPKPDDPAQSKRFIKMARKVEAEGSKEDFEQAFKKIAKAKPKDEQSSKS